MARRFRGSQGQMICLGLNDTEKDVRISKYCRDNGIDKVFILSPAKFRFGCSFSNHEQIEYDQIIQYKYFYRLLQEIGPNTLVVVNECLRTQDRYGLTYNCIRNYLNQTHHQIVFQYLPLIDQFDDFMILVDLDTRSRWKREKWSEGLRCEFQLEISPVEIVLHPTKIKTDAKTKRAYVAEKRKLIDGIGLKDPHTIPRNLYLMSGKAKLSHVNGGDCYVGRNNRFKIAGMRTYADTEFPYSSTVFEYCHNFINFSDFLALSRQAIVPVLVADLKVDEWYNRRYAEWTQRVRDAYATIHG